MKGLPEISSPMGAEISVAKPSPLTYYKSRPKINLIFER
jgi:hypothetical protein